MTPSEALAENNRKVEAVIAALKKAGAKADEIQTSNFSIYPQFEYVENRRPRIVGYQVVNSVTVTREATADAGKMLQAAVEAGVNQASGLNFFVADETPGRTMAARRSRASSTATRPTRSRASGRATTARRAARRTRARPTAAPSRTRRPTTPTTRRPKARRRAAASTPRPTPRRRATSRRAPTRRCRRSVMLPPSRCSPLPRLSGSLDSPCCSARASAPHCATPL